MTIGCHHVDPCPIARHAHSLGGQVKNPVYSIMCWSDGCMVPSFLLIWSFSMTKQLSCFCSSLLAIPAVQACRSQGAYLMVVKGLQQGLVGKVKVPTVDEVPKAISRWPCWEAEYLQGLCVCVCCLIQNWLLWTIELYFAIAHPVIQSNFRQLTDTSPWSRTGGPAFEELK